MILAQISRFTVLYNVLICLFIVLAVLFVLMLVFYFVRPVDHLYKRIVHGEPEEETEEEAPEHDIFTQMEMRIAARFENCCAANALRPAKRRRWPPCRACVRNERFLSC